MNNKILSLIVITAISPLLLCSACGNQNSEDAVDYEVAVPVKAKVFPARSIYDLVSSTGKVEGIREVKIVAEVGGTVIKINADLGREVRKGDILAAIDDRTIAAGFKQARSQLNAARNGFEQAERDYKRYRQLLDEGNVSAFEFEQAEFKYKNARAQLGLAEANYEVAAKQLEDTRIESPIPGYVSFRYVEEHQVIAAGTPVADVVDDSRVLVKFSVSEGDVDKIQKGQEVRIESRNSPGEVIYGMVRGVGRAAGKTTLTYPVEIEASNPQRVLKSGMLVKADIVVETYYDAMALPNEIIGMDNGRNGVYVIRGDRAYFKPLEIKTRIDPFSIIESGVSATDTIVTDGIGNISDSTLVKIVSLEVDS